ncbi:hypothetical protein C5E07_01280 [Pseudoclavibacter sp. RFBJ3]|nr:hypothetical protein C5C12_02495 [Pseudoclavibacter sp. RFBJ5]PPF94873.1 hypothetical protein C5C19_17940 [Pseudoclavibacter sp. RFBH5]PPF95506.1 hypothetical protein C5E07_01280 [Pseudoclavibacter sp. RFBJ3]PPG19518.1 hypothetical protein C5E13_16705 [Pseudoclavibacter sp. RFBI4]
MSMLTVRWGADGRLDRWGYAGLRTAATRASDEAWRAGHEAALRPANTGAGAGIVFAIVSVLSANSVAPYLVALSLAVLSTLTGVILSLVIAHRAAKAVAGK